MKRFINFFKSKKQEMPSENSYQGLSGDFGRMLDCVKINRQIGNDIWYS